jgi:DNA processing protein
MNKQTEHFLKIYLTEGVGYKFLKRFYETFKTFDGNIDEILTRFGELQPSLSPKVEAVRKNLPRAEGLIETLKEEGIEVIPFYDKRFPSELQRLEEVAALFVKGNFEPFRGFAIVGTRRASAEGRLKAFEFAAALSKEGFAVISGGAEGIDKAAHEGALSVGGRTGVVLGEGILNFLKSKRRFAEKVLRGGGFLVSQFPPTAKPAKWTFPKRNALIAALSPHGTLVVEAPAKSGALITADYTLRLKRPLFAYIGCTSNPNHLGCVGLVETCRARLTVAPERLIEFLKSAEVEINQQPPAEEEDLLLTLLAQKPRTFDELLALAGLEEEELIARLTELELEGKISAEGGYYKLI